jgi:segregation and condensation protein B
VEALLFAAQDPMSVNALVKAVGEAGVAAADVKAVLESLGAAYDAENRGFKLVRLGSGYQVVTRERHEPWVRRLLAGKQRTRLSRAALETVAVIAYKQPITRLDIEGIRGVDVGGVLGTLLERGIIMIKGRDPGPGRPLLYGTTSAFLDYFGIARLSDLPKMEEIAALAAAERGPVWDEGERARFEKMGVDPDVDDEEAAPEGEVDDAAADTDTASRDEDREAFQEVATDFAAGTGADAESRDADTETGAAVNAESEAAPDDDDERSQAEPGTTSPGTPGPGY